MKVYEIITNRIIEMLEHGQIPWNRPWDVHNPVNLVSRKEYRGVNVLMLSHTGFKSPYWLTFNQAQMLGGHVKRGEKGLPVVFWSMVKGKADTNGEEEMFPLLRYHTVFNLEQIEGIAIPETEKIEFKFNPIAECESVMSGMPQRPMIQHGGNQASYSPGQDIIRMPRKDSFQSIESYYGTLFHETVHSTGHKDRLNRVSISEPHAFGSETYSKEELIAELGASFLCSHTGISNVTIENQAGYIQNWLRKLKNDKRLIIIAASHAQKAVDFILGRKQENHEN